MYTDLERYREMYIEIERAIGRYRDRKTESNTDIERDVILSITLHHVNHLTLCEWHVSVITGFCMVSSPS